MNHDFNSNLKKTSKLNTYLIKSNQLSSSNNQRISGSNYKSTKSELNSTKGPLGNNSVLNNSNNLTVNNSNYNNYCNVQTEVVNPSGSNSNFFQPQSSSIKNNNPPSKQTNYFSKPTNYISPVISTTQTSNQNQLKTKTNNHLEEINRMLQINKPNYNKSPPKTGNLPVDQAKNLKSSSINLNQMGLNFKNKPGNINQINQNNSGGIFYNSSVQKQGSSNSNTTQSNLQSPVVTSSNSNIPVNTSTNFVKSNLNMNIVNNTSTTGNIKSGYQSKDFLVVSPTSKNKPVITNSTQYKQKIITNIKGTGISSQMSNGINQGGIVNGFGKNNKNINDVQNEFEDEVIISKKEDKFSSKQLSKANNISNSNHGIMSMRNDDFNFSKQKEEIDYGRLNTDINQKSSNVNSISNIISKMPDKVLSGQNSSRKKSIGNNYLIENDCYDNMVYDCEEGNNGEDEELKQERIKSQVGFENSEISKKSEKSDFYFNENTYIGPELTHFMQVRLMRNCINNLELIEK